MSGSYTPTIASPRIAPPQQFTNVATLMGGGNRAATITTSGTPVLPGSSLPGTSFPGFAPTTVTLGQAYGPAEPVKVVLFRKNRFSSTGSAVLPGSSLPGTSFPGFAHQVVPYGLMLSEGHDYMISGGVIVMTEPPTPDDILTAIVFAVGVALGGPNPTRYLAPWILPLPLEGDYDGIGTLYRVVFGPTISGVLDGVNRVFTFGVTLSRSTVFVNGALKTLNVDVVTGPTSIVFLAGHVPVPGDLITITGWL